MGFDWWALPQARAKGRWGSAEELVGEVRLAEEDGRVVIEVLAEDHFLAGISTLYRFYIDEKLWLPVEVQEFTPDGIVKRDVLFRGLKTSIGITDGFFRIGRGNGKDEQSGG